MSKFPQLVAALVAAATFALAVAAPVGSGAPNPCPGNYSVHVNAPEDQNPDYLAADVNGNGIVCVYDGLSKKADPVRDDRVSQKK